MKMGENKFSAQDVIKYLSANELEKVFKYFGEEKYSKLISKKIVNKRKYGNLLTEDLVDIVNSTKKTLQKKINLQKFFKH